MNTQTKERMDHLCGFEKSSIALRYDRFESPKDFEESKSYLESKGYKVYKNSKSWAPDLWVADKRP